MFKGTILAIDSAIRSGIAEGVPGDTPALSYVDFAHDSLDDHADIFARALRWMGRRCADNPPAMLVLEDLVLVHDKTVNPACMRSSKPSPAPRASRSPWCGSTPGGCMCWARAISKGRSPRRAPSRCASSSAGMSR